jgi:serine phosphatase RsbU (regulator of sigma subunit)
MSGSSSTGPVTERIAGLILGTLAEAVTVHDAGGQTVYANEAAVRLLDAESIDEVLSAKPGALAARFTISHEDGRPVAVSEFPGRRLAVGQPGDPILTRSVLKRTGEERWLLTKAATVHDDDGELLVVNIIEDVTRAQIAQLRERFLSDAGQALSSSLDYEETLQRVARLAVPQLADWCAVEMPDEWGGLQQVALAHVDPEKVALAQRMRERYPPRPDEVNGVPAVLRSGQSELYPEIPEELLEQAGLEAEQLQLIRDVGLRSVMIVPMRVGERVLGAMTFASADSERRFDEDDLDFAEGVARRAAVAIENARLYTERARIAETLQESLLPDRLPDLPGWELEASYAAGERGSDVGGDFYDVFPVEGGFMVVLGDVTGRGVAAAALTATVRHTARTGALFDARPAAILALVNRVLCDQSNLAPVTLVCAHVERRPQGAQITLASGGHPLPILRRADGTLERVGFNDLLLGVMRDERWDEHSSRLEPGDAILFYTDGVTETPGADERFGEDRLMGVVEGADGSPAALLAATEAALMAFRARDVSDDRALLALRFIGD